MPKEMMNTSTTRMEARDDITMMKLPNELLSEIAELLDKTDLLSLRLTGNEVAAIVDSVFVQRCFSKRSHVFTCHGLEALVAITEVPRLVKKVEVLELYVVGSDVAGSGDMVLRSLNAIRREEIQMISTLRDVYGREQAALYDSCKADLMLRSVFANLAKIGHQVSLAVQVLGFDDRETGPLPYGAHEFSRRLSPGLGRLHYEYYATDGSVSLRSVLSSVAASRIPLKDLILFFGERLNGVGAAPFRDSEALLSDTCHCFRSLRSLKIHMRSSLMEDRNAEERDYFTSLMESAVNLEGLTVETDEKDDYWALASSPGWIFDSLRTSRMRILDLTGFFAKEWELRRFFERFCNTLKSLRLQSLSLPQGDCWIRLCECIESELHLEDLHLENLQRGNVEILVSEGELGAPQACHEFDFDGEEAVKEGLRSLQRADYERYM